MPEQPLKGIQSGPVFLSALFNIECHKSQPRAMQSYNNKALFVSIRPAKNKLSSLFNRQDEQTQKSVKEVNFLLKIKLLYSLQDIRFCVVPECI